MLNIEMNVGQCGVFFFLKIMICDIDIDML